MSILAVFSNRVPFGRRPSARGPAAWLFLGACSLALIAGCSESPGQKNSAATSEQATGEQATATGERATRVAREKRVADDERASSDEGAQAHGDARTAGNRTGTSLSAVDMQLQEDLIRAVIDNFNRLDEFDSNQILPQLCSRLNQWMLQSRRASTWQRDPLLETLDAPLSSAPVVAYFLKNLDTGLFTFNDMVGLQELIWLRDIAKNARGSQLDDLSIAEQLFDWTVRNIQLVDEPPTGTPAVIHTPAEILLLSRGTARERAWIFLLLLRQQGLDGVMLAIPGEAGGAPREWLTALVTDDDLFLFDPWLGLPLPGPEGHRVATLADVVADDELLRKLDLSSTRPYPVKAEQLGSVVAYVEASPLGLSRRMETLEARLTGDQRVVLTARPQRVAERLVGRPHIDKVACWPLPYELWQARGALKPGQPPPTAAETLVFQVVGKLVKGRMLQFKGAIDGERGAIAYYFDSRLPKPQLAKMRPEEQKVWLTAKQDASYWLGLIAFEKQDYAVAIDYFKRRTLEATPDGPWTDGASYNLGRSYEASGELARAIEVYQSDRSPQKHGNRLRARRLKAQSTGVETTEEKNP